MAQFQSVKCAEHKAEAIAICAYCGRALCVDCAKHSETLRMVCSDTCAMALLQNNKAMQLLLHKSVQSAQASAFNCYLCGGLSLAAAVGAHFYLPSPFLIFFTVGCGGVFIISGIWYGRMAGKQNSDSKN
jgi:hypothetical protein